MEKDQEALAVYLEEIQDKTIYFDTEIERLHYLVDNDFYFDVLKNIQKRIYKKLQIMLKVLTFVLPVICQQVNSLKTMR